MHASSNIERTWALLCRVSMVPTSQCGGNMDLMQGEYGTSITMWGNIGLIQGEYGTTITMWGEHGPYAG